jgi:hypothetical protein
MSVLFFLSFIELFMKFLQSGNLFNLWLKYRGEQNGLN